MKTTRPEARLRRPALLGRSAAERVDRMLDAVPDRIDLRDWVYRPLLAALPDVLVNCDRVPEILDQGGEGACTGFALAAVIQFHLAARGIRKKVSPRMLYEIARRYDDWPGDSYDGSSARGAMKAWVAHGVCGRTTWPDDRHGAHHFTRQAIGEARAVPGGAYYRVQHRAIRDMHAALADVGILYATLMVHHGWAEPKGPSRRGSKGWTLPTIRRRGRATNGHAVALVGYTSEGFIVQNSWGRAWGEGGFALLPYEDYLIHATDVWVAQLGVPISIDLWSEGVADTTAGLQRAAPTIPLADIRPYVINVGNNGLLSDSGAYWTTEQDVERMFTEEIPRTAAAWSKQRVMLYLHGGLNDEREAARRAVAFRDVCLANEIYPVHVIWETGGRETLRSIIDDRFGVTDARAAGIRDWLDRFRDHLIEARDRTFELTISRPGTMMWDEMKENARLASHRDDKRGAMQLLIRHARRAVGRLPPKQQRNCELHVVAHSAGSIFAAYALEHLLRLGVAFRSLTFMAPAISIELFKALMVPQIRSGKAPLPSVFLLSDQGERDDTVGPYGKSLLYLVSNAFERGRDTPLLGMQRFLQPLADERTPDAAVRKLFERTIAGRPSLVIAGATPASAAEDSRSRSATHGGFDNDEWTLNAVLWRILGKEPRRRFTAQDLQY